MPTTSSIVSAVLEGSSASRDEDIAKLIIVSPQNTAYWRIITGISGVQENIARADLMGKFKAAVTRGIDPFNALGIPKPKKLQTTKARAVQVTRGGTLPHRFTFTSANYTATNINNDSSSFDFVLASPGSLCAVGQQLQTYTDTNNAVQMKVNSVTEILGGGATINVQITSGTVSGDITNSSTPKTLISLGNYAGEGSDLQSNPYRTSSSESFSLAKLQHTIQVTPEANRTTYDTVDKAPIPKDKYVAMCSTMLRVMNNALVLSNDSASLIDPDNNTYNTPNGILNRSGPDTISLASTGLGPSGIQQAAKEIIYDGYCAQVPFDLGPGDKPILDVICDSTRSLMWDRMLKSSNNSHFGTQVMVKMGDTKFSTILSMFETRDAWIRVHHEESMDSTGYSNQMVMFNANSIIPVIKEGFWFDTQYSPKDSNPNKHMFAVTTIYNQIFLVDDQIKFFSNVNFLEGI